MITMQDDNVLAECGFFQRSFRNTLYCEEPIVFSSKAEKVKFIKKCCYKLETSKECEIYKRLMAEKYKDVG